MRSVTFNRGGGNSRVLGEGSCGWTDHREGSERDEDVSEVAVDGRMASGLKPRCLTELGGSELTESC